MPWSAERTWAKRRHIRCIFAISRGCAKRSASRARASSYHEWKVADEVVQHQAASPANAAATSPASPAFATMRSRLTRRVSPSERSCRAPEHVGGHACPLTPRAVAFGATSSISSATSRLSSGARPAEDRVPTETPVGIGDLRELVRALHASRDRRASGGRVEERQGVDTVSDHRHAEGLEQLHRRRHVEQRLDPGGRDHRRVRAHAARSAETSGGVGRPECTPAEAAGPHEGDTDRRGGDEGAAERSSPRPPPGTAHTARSRGPSCARRG